MEYRIQITREMLAVSGKDAQRRLRLIAAGVPFVVAVLIVVLIIPLVATDTFRGGNPRGSSIAFGVNAILHVLLTYLAFRSNRSSGSISVWLGAFALTPGRNPAGPRFRVHGAPRPARSGSRHVLLCVQRRCRCGVSVRNGVYEIPSGGEARQVVRVNCYPPRWKQGRHLQRESKF